jgi:hypothetical protein
MGYFSNGSEGLDWQVHNCDKCLNADELGACAIWDAHLLYNGEEGKKDVLNMLIPKDGIWNGQCKLLREK